MTVEIDGSSRVTSGISVEEGAACADDDDGNDDSVWLGPGEDPLIEDPLD